MCEENEDKISGKVKKLRLTLELDLLIKMYY